MGKAVEFEVFITDNLFNNNRGFYQGLADTYNSDNKGTTSLFVAVIIKLCLEVGSNEKRYNKLTDLREKAENRSLNQDELLNELKSIVKEIKEEE